MKRSPYLAKIRVTILSLLVSPNMVIFWGICRNWWKLRWWNDHRILWQFMWRFCHFLFHPIWWFFGRSARNGENWSDEEITTFGDNLCDDFVTFCFTQYGEFLGDLPELVRIKVIKITIFGKTKSDKIITQIVTKYDDLFTTLILTNFSSFP